MRTEFAKLLKLLRKHHPDLDEDLIRRAYRVANEAHGGQVRLSGEPYIMHPLAVARILASLHLDVTTVAAGLLHDVLEDTQIEKKDLEKQFGKDIAMLVDSVSKITQLHLTHPTLSAQEKQAENIRKLLVATAQDIRVLLIKLADRLHNIRTIEHLPERKIRRICRETLDIYAPLAHRLGIEQWKWELEDHAFHHLYTDEYHRIAKRIAMKRREREQLLTRTCGYLEERLLEAEVEARVIGRPKHLYSIYQKMVQQGKDFDQVMDILAIRIIAQSIGGCYNALGVVHQLWPPVPGRFKDYIAMPKVNMYQSIHTTVMRENGLPMEVQIRTEDMDRTAREGIAAHWKYKEGRAKGNEKLDKELGWLKQMYEWLVDASTPEELFDSMRRDVSLSDIYAFTPKGEVKELPNGATALDFAYIVHSEVGHSCIGARVNGNIVPLHYNLQTGDMVDILTSKSQKPHLDWLKTVVTGKARTRIRQKLREMGEIEPLDVQIDFEPGVATPPQPAKPKPKAPLIDEARRHQLVRVAGEKGLDVEFARCCNPLPGDTIIAYALISGGMRVHRVDCKVFNNGQRDPKRTFMAHWVGSETLEIGVRVTTGQRPNLLADITNVLRPMNITITRARFEPQENNQTSFEFVFEADNQEHADRVMRTIKTIAGIQEVQLLPPGELAKAS